MSVALIITLRFPVYLRTTVNTIATVVHVYSNDLNGKGVSLELIVDRK